MLINGFPTYFMILKDLFDKLLKSMLNPKTSIHTNTHTMVGTREHILALLISKNVSCLSHRGQSSFWHTVNTGLVPVVYPASIHDLCDLIDILLNVMLNPKTNIHTNTHSMDETKEHNMLEQLFCIKC